jgi:hypothetical protein
MIEKEVEISVANKEEKANSNTDLNNVISMAIADGVLTKNERETIRKKELAVKIVKRTSNSMKLEDQENSEIRLKKAIEERITSLKNEVPKILWD